MADEVADAEREELAGVAHHHQYAALGRRVDAEPAGVVLQDWILLVNSPRGPFGRNPGKLERAGKVSSGRWATLAEFAKSISNGTTGISPCLVISIEFGLSDRKFRTYGRESRPARRRLTA